MGKEYEYYHKRAEKLVNYAKNDADWSTRIWQKYNGQCIWPGCGSTWNLSPHHIIDRRYKRLKLLVENGVLLCAKHHDLIERAMPKDREQYSILLVGEKAYLTLRAGLRLTSSLIRTDSSQGLPSSRDKAGWGYQWAPK